MCNPQLGSLGGDLLLVTAVDATLGESRLKPYAADSFIVYAQPPERAGGRCELADNAHVVQVRHKRCLLARCINPLQHWLQREREQVSKHAFLQICRSAMAMPTLSCFRALCATNLRLDLDKCA